MKSLRIFSPPILVWLLRRCAWYLGWISMLLALLLIVLLVVFSQQQQDNLARIVLLKQEIRKLERQQALFTLSSTSVIATTTLVRPLAENTYENWANLWQQLPTLKDLSPIMLQIAHLAQKHQIALNMGDYQWQLHPASVTSQEIQQFDMRFTIQTDYVTCRQFINDVLRQYPAMALTSFELHKAETMQTVLEAKLGFSVFIRGGQVHER